MKIKLDENEVYEIAIEDEYTLQEFLQLLGRLVKISQALVSK